MKSFLFSFLLIFFTAFSFSHLAQELQCDVTINYEQLAIEYKEKLLNFKSEVENYLNNTRFTDSEWQGEKIKCSFTIFFTSGSSETQYSAQVVVASRRQIYNSSEYSPMLKVLDANWSFQYERNQPFYFTPSLFNSLTSFLDFYAFLIIGLDWDSWDKLAGNQYYHQAYRIAKFGATSNFSKGWEKEGSYSRLGIVENLINEKYRPFREAFYEYHYGIDIYNQNKKIGYEKIVHLINVLYSNIDQIDFNSSLLRAFFDAKSGEIVKYLAPYAGRSVFEKLKRVDPSHASEYEKLISSN